MNCTRRLVALTLVLGGSVPLLPAQAGTFSEIYSFKGGTDGQAPWGSVIVEGGTLYGTTNAGGAAGNGIVFAVDASNGKETVLHSFGTGTDGAAPRAGLTYEGGLLWGTTYGGGGAGLGTIFTVDPTKGTEKVVYSFGAESDGANPEDNLLYHYGLFFGTTFNGGAHVLGTVFVFDPHTGKEKVLWSFGAQGNDGYNPAAGLIAVGVNLYGTTVQGGDYAQGTAFEFNLSSGKETILHSFSGGADSAGPTGALVNHDGTLFGAATCPSIFSACRCIDCPGRFGSIFSYGLKNSSYAVLYDFQGKEDGEYPVGALNDYDGSLFGIASGGISNGGNVFKLKPAATSLSIPYTFPGRSYPVAGLLYRNGAFYGTTIAGGKHQRGSVVKIVP
jgi:uncharacterized repeat protein (TIGR03803 family)